MNLLQLFILWFTFFGNYNFSENKKSANTTDPQEQTYEEYAHEKVIFKKLTIDQLLDTAMFYKKSIMVDCMADYCLPCKQMAKYTFTDQKLANYLNENFIVTRWNGSNFDDMDNIYKYNVKSYPTILIINAKGVERYRVAGFQSAEKLLTIAQNYKAGKLTNSTKTTTATTSTTANQKPTTKTKKK